ncbi:MAG: hypothetical protein H8E73_06985 [Planctomycetes bacterium]|nr:hypothetical protein [Planctomycetota bacterium]
MNRFDECPYSGLGPYTPVVTLSEIPDTSRDGENGCSYDKKGSSNVILERLTITNPNDYGEGDGVSLKEDIQNVFITKC